MPIWALILIALALASWLYLRSDYRRGIEAAGSSPLTAVDLDTQLDLLSRAGLTLSPDATRENLTDSWSEEEYEKDPYALLLFSMASEIEAEPWGRPMSERGFMLDMECIEDDGSYVAIVRNIARAGGVDAQLTEVTDAVDLEAGTARLHYVLGDISRDLTPRVDDDWADPATVTQIMQDVEALMPAGHHLWMLDNGQASGIFGLSDEGAALINAQVPGVLFRDPRG